MKYYIGIDGGGTKTSVAIADGEGKILNTLLYSGCSYQEIGIDAVVSLISNGVKEILSSVSAENTSCVGCCIGLPCFGENTQKDTSVKEKIEQALSPIPTYIVNDGVVGWAGSLNCQEGIHMVAGTGSIAIGCDAEGKAARCGGWSELFGDEGSCYWVGKKAMQLFSKEADGRIPKTPLYANIREMYEIENDYDFIDIMTQEVLPFRDKVAALQRVALKSAREGDREVIKIYEEAAMELADMVLGVKNQLTWKENKVKVSYFGGLFHAKEFVLPKFEEKLNAMNCSLQEPKFSATEGAVLLAIKKFTIV